MRIRMYSIFVFAFDLFHKKRGERKKCSALTANENSGKILPVLCPINGDRRGVQFESIKFRMACENTLCAIRSGYDHGGLLLSTLAARL